MEKHLGAQLSVKGLAQYEGRLCDEADARRALQPMERALAAAQPLADTHRWPA